MRPASIPLVKQSSLPKPEGLVSSRGSLSSLWKPSVLSMSLSSHGISSTRQDLASCTGELQTQASQGLSCVARESILWNQHFAQFILRVKNDYPEMKLSFLIIQRGVMDSLLKRTPRLHPGNRPWVSVSVTEVNEVAHSRPQVSQTLQDASRKNKATT